MGGSPPQLRRGMNSAYFMRKKGEVENLVFLLFFQTLRLLLLSEPPPFIQREEPHSRSLRPLTPKQFLKTKNTAVGGAL